MPNVVGSFDHVSSIVNDLWRVPILYVFLVSDESQTFFSRVDVLLLIWQWDSTYVKGFVKGQT